MSDNADDIAFACEFWIDVGGTFTDCFARWPDGTLTRRKLLSTGITKGSMAPGSTRRRILDPLRAGDPVGIWNGFRLRLLRAGRTVGESVVAASRENGVLELASALADYTHEGDSYELQSDEEAPLVAMRYLLSLPLDQALPRVSVRLGTTRGTNALLTRRGARTALVTTRGFGDVLRIGYQNRPRLFDVDIIKPEPLFAEVVEIDERIATDGQVLIEPIRDTVERDLCAVRAQGIDSLAICLLQAFDHPRHEQWVETIARAIGFREISSSHRVAPLIKLVSRGDTTVVDAYLNPVLRRYLASLGTALGPSSQLRIMTSAGGLVGAEQFTGKDSVLSGPAGGVVGFSGAARRAGFERAIGFDMGGTSTDVSRFDGRFEFEYETEKAGVRIVAPMLKIHTVAAGGGSVCRFDGVKLVVGPESSGADPGPACYGRNGPLSVTDLNFFLNRLPADRFPFELHRAAVEARLAELTTEIHYATEHSLSAMELCEGFLKIANQNMVQAIRSISVAKGVDPRDYVLVAFGGAAGQHACAVACELGIRQLLCPADAGLLSAYGMGVADITRHRVSGVYTPYSEAAVRSLETVFHELEQTARHEIETLGIPASAIVTRRSLDLRYQGLDAYLTLLAEDGFTFAELYAREHERLYGYVRTDRPLEIVAARIEAVGRVSECDEQASSSNSTFEAPPARTAPVWFESEIVQTAIYERNGLKPGQQFLGPAILCEPTSTLVIEPGWRANILGNGDVLLTDLRSVPAPIATSTAADPVMLEIFNNQFAGIAEQMGIALRNTASSVNVKERLDFSCALFNAEGQLIVNAPHIPVHLGAMGVTVRAIIAHNPDLRPGDVFATNDPYLGGSHLPDVTVVTPVHDTESGRLLFFTASRAHHAEIGGIVPGSMPPFSTNLAQEGVLIRNFRLMAAGQSRLAELEKLLVSAPYPTRAVADNLADLNAQMAANQQGLRDLHRLVLRYSLPVVEAYMNHIQTAAEQKLRQALARLPAGRHEFADFLDDGCRIAVAVTIRHDSPNGASATIDFTGTAGVLAGNLNANKAIVTAAVLYVLRLLIAEDIPLNEGVLNPVEIIIPECLLNPPRYEDAEKCAAVVGGNVETSQRVVDALIGALRIAAASQGTMNNLLFGDSTFGYYETICGGSGASRNRAGADAVHTHMTNTRLTDPEVLERRYPVRLKEFSIRRNSGGYGVHRGGDGIVRRIEFLAPLEVSILSQRRGPYPPFGMDGGEPGALGQNVLFQASGEIVHLPNQVQFSAQVGDVLTIETPGGGGWGSADKLS